MEKRGGMRGRTCSNGRPPIRALLPITGRRKLALARADVGQRGLGATIAVPRILVPALIFAKIGCGAVMQTGKAKLLDGRTVACMLRRIRSERPSVCLRRCECAWKGGREAVFSQANGLDSSTRKGEKRTPRPIDLQYRHDVI